MEAEDLDDRERLAIRYGELFATNHLAIDDEFYDRMRELFTEPEIVELGLNVALCVGVGRLSATWDMVDDLPDRFRAPRRGHAVGGRRRHRRQPVIGHARHPVTSAVPAARLSASTTSTGGADDGHRGTVVPGRQLRRRSRRAHRARPGGDGVDPARRCRGGTCATGRTRPTAPPPTGSSATAWCTASAWRAAGRRGTATAGSGRRSSRGPRGDRSRDDDGPDGQRRQHPRAGPRRADLGARGGAPPLRALARAGHAGVRRLRRRVDDRLHGSPQAVPGDRRAALLRLRRAAAVPDVPRARRRRRARPLGADHGRQADDDARLHDHEGPRRVHGPPGRVRPGGDPR